jgi:serine/alanine adding enzyme
LKFACGNSYKAFDFGRSTPGEGTYRFKEQWGANPVQLYWHYWMRNGGPLPELNPKNPKYQMAIKIWKKLPVAVTKLIGPRIVKNLP